MPKHSPHVLALSLTATGAIAACGRTAPIQPNGAPPVCSLAFSPVSLEFGPVKVGATSTLEVSLSNNGEATCHVSAIALAPGTASDFALDPGASRSIDVPAGRTDSISVRFSPSEATPPLQRSGSLTFRTGDASHPMATVPLTGSVDTNCSLAIAPGQIDLGHVPLGSSASGSVTLSDQGDGVCEIGLTLASGSDPEFSLSPGQSTVLTLAVGQSASVSVTFDATDVSPPHQRSGVLVLKNNDPAKPNVNVPLSAEIDIGCDVTVSPASLSFGNVILNTTVSGTVTLGNDGSAACDVSNIALGSGTDPEFALGSGQATSFVIPPGGSDTVTILFAGSDSAPPHLKTGTLAFLTGNPRSPSATVPLSAYINTVCTLASQWIYTVDLDGMFSRFDPKTLTFTDIGPLNCPNDISGPFAMAVDQNAVAWVVYADGQLFQVDTSTAACQSTTFQVNQDGLLNFGMGFVFQPSTGDDTLYVAGGSNYFTNPTYSTLATVSFPGLAVSPIGRINAGFPDLTGTGDGELWGFMPSFASSSGVAVLDQFDLTTGATLASYSYPALTINGSWAMKFWGGSFWIFLGPEVLSAPRTAPGTLTTQIANTGRNIVGAGVSTCAPTQ